MSSKECTRTVRTRPRWAAWFAVLTAIGGSSARADVPAITPDPNLVLGNLLNCTAHNDDNVPMVISWSWNVRGVTPGGVQFPVGFQASADTVMFAATSPITYIVSCTVSYRPPRGPKQLTINISISPPASVRIDAGTPATLDVGASDSMVFAILDGNGKKVGGYIGGVAQEKLTGQVDWFGNKLPDVDWWPSAPNDTFKMGGGNILDIWWVGGSFAAAPIGATEESTQQLRIHFEFSDRSVKNYVIGVIDYTQTKVGTRTWKLEASQ
jgi:hypothetical protein